MKNKQVMVIGCPRSGTSYIANALNMIGVFMGETFLQPDNVNPGGYYEDVKFLRLNKGILKSLDTDWKTGISKNDLFDIEKKFIVSAEKLIEFRDSLHIVWGWKDPRNTLLMQFYWRKLENPLVVIVHRNRDKIIASLQKAFGDGDWGTVHDMYINAIKTNVNELAIPQSRILNFNYDIFISSPERIRAEIIKELCYFVGVGDFNIQDAVDCFQRNIYVK